MIILPKKSYCPWNRTNLERVERDEKQHQEQLDRERKEQRKEESKSRLKQLHGGKEAQSDNGERTTERFNLFEKEETEHLRLHAQQVVLSRGSRCDQGHASGSRCTSNDDEQKRPRGKPSDEIPFYLKPKRDFERESLSAPSHQDHVKEGRIKDHLDPMKGFHSSFGKEYGMRQAAKASIATSSGAAICKESRCDRGARTHEYRKGDDDFIERGRKKEEDHKKRKKSRKHREGEKKAADKRRKKEEGTDEDGWEQLRKRRAEREELERRRQQDLLGQSNAGGNSRYNDQYNPRFSRN